MGRRPSLKIGGEFQAHPSYLPALLTVAGLDSGYVPGLVRSVELPGRLRGERVLARKGFVCRLHAALSNGPSCGF